ncbi:MAG: FkbM family methyltransferase [Gemmobacter sp.]
MIDRLIARLTLAHAGLRAPPLDERMVTMDTPQGPRSLVRSAFNPAWLAEAGIAPGVIVDLGAFDGGDALRLARAFPAARVVTVEADPTRHALVAAMLEGTGVAVVHAAACETDGPVPWYPAAVGGVVDSQGSLYRRSARAQRMHGFVQQAATPVAVPGLRFDTLMARFGIGRVDLLHMDIEGAEGAVIRSLGPHRPAMIFTEARSGYFENGQSAGDTHRALRMLGYARAMRLGVDSLYLAAPGLAMPGPRG